MSRPVHERFDSFGLAVGAWVAALVIPAVGVGASRLLDPDVGSLALLVLLGGPTVAVVVSVAVPTSLAVRLADSRLHHALPVLPLAALLPLVRGAIHGSPVERPVLALSLLALAGGTLAGLGAWAAAENRYASVMTTGASELARWSARPDPDRRRHLRWLSAGLLVLGAAVVLASHLVHPSLLPLLGGIVGAVISIHRHRGRPREFVATDRGLTVHTSGTVVTRFVPWNRFADYTRTADALVLHRRGWPSIRCDVADLADPDAVRYAVERAISGTDE